MPSELKINFPRALDKEYFSFEKQRYVNDLSIYINDAMLVSHINDAQEYLPITITKPIDLDTTKENVIKFAYRIKFGPDKEDVDVIFKLQTNGVCETTIHRHNYVPGSELLEDAYLVTFLINNYMTQLDKSWYEGEVKDIVFESNYSYPLTVRWFSYKPFIGGSEYWDDIDFTIREQL